MNRIITLVRFLLSVSAIALFIQLQPAVASAQTCPTGYVCTYPVLATLSLDASSPIRNTVGVTNTVQGQYLNLPVLVFDVNAQGDTLHLHSITANVSAYGNGTVSAAYLYQGSTPIASAAVVNGIATFANITDNQAGATIPVNATVPFTIKVDVSGLSAPSSLETIGISVSSPNVTIYASNDSNATVTSAANGNLINVVANAPMFTITSAPTLVQQNITPPGTTSILMKYTASFNVSVSNAGNAGNNSISLGLPTSQNPAFGSATTGSNIAQLFINGSADANNAGYQVIASYSQPTNTTLSSDGKSFIIVPNQTVTIPVTYNFAVTNPGANIYGLQLLGGVYSNVIVSTSTYPLPMFGLISGACTVQTGAACAPATTTPPVSPSATFNGSSTLLSVYATSTKSSALVATFHVSINGGSQGVAIYQGTAGGISFVGTNGNNSASGVSQSETVTPITANLLTVKDINGSVLYWVPAGQTASFVFSDTINPQLLFADTYYATLTGISANTDYSKQDGFTQIVPPTNKTNSQTIVGEISPYISSVTNPISAGQTMTITGQRLNGAQVSIDNAVMSNVIIAVTVNGTSLSFNLPQLSTGQHTLFVTGPNGKSNIIAFQVTSATPANPVPFVGIVGHPTLTLSYDSSHKESLLTATYEINVKSAAAFNLYKTSGDIDFFRSDGSNAQANSESATTITPITAGIPVIVDSYGQQMYQLNAGQAAQFRVVATIPPSQLFAGTYYASLTSLYSNPGRIGPNQYEAAVPSNKTNSETIVGELSPYISSVISPINSGQTMTVTGQRLVGGSVLIDGSSLIPASSVTNLPNGNALSFILPTLSTGDHYLTVNSVTTGFSNRADFQVTAVQSTTTQPVIASVSPSIAPAGASITVSGTGFDLTNRFNDGVMWDSQDQVAYAASFTSDGKSMIFNVPYLVSGAHTITAVAYEAGNGWVTGNTVPFTIGTSTSTSTPPSNKPPVIAGLSAASQLTTGQAGTWSIIASDPQNGPLNYWVSWGDSSATSTATVLTAGAQTSTFVHQYSVPGNYTVTFIVADSVGLSARATAPVQVTSIGRGGSGNYSSGNYSFNAASPATTDTADILTSFVNFIKGLF